MPIACLLLTLLFAPRGELTPVKLRCEYLVNPIGLGEREPRFSWALEATARAQAQGAYRVLVATSLDKLKEGTADLWDSGQVSSDECAHVVYAGRALASRTAAFWAVRVWDHNGAASPYSAPASFEIGLLERGDWRARFVSLAPRAPEAPPTFASSRWIWAKPADPHASTIHVRRTIELPAGAQVERAVMMIGVRDASVLHVNGKEVAHGSGADQPQVIEFGAELHAGKNLLALEAQGNGADAGVIGHLAITLAGGREISLETNAEWRLATEAPAGWTEPDFADREWTAASEVARAGEEPWGKPRDVVPPGPCPLLRRTFTLSAPVRQARLYVTALGLYEMHLNGARVGADLFTPGCTDYNKRVQYQTYDVTSLLRAGDNVIGAVLGEGWYAGHIGWNKRRNHYGRISQLCAQLEIHYQDGRQEIVATDERWKAATGPIVLSDLLMGESYDARLETPGWDRKGFDDGSWRAVVPQEAPAAALVAEPDTPPRRIDELAPVAITEPRPGAFVFDLGQNMVGFARLRVQGAAGTQVTLRFAEVLNPDGTIYTTNLRGATATDRYMLRGGGPEVFEPHFTFHGFRYVEVSGYPGKPGNEAITGVVVSSAGSRAGTFSCSSQLLNQLQHNIAWGLRGNFLSIPTDCPQRDERLGWMGDAQIFARTACFNQDLAAFFTKWLDDVDDAQSAAGGFSNVSPRIVDLGDGAPAWGDAGVIVPWVVSRAYGDLRVLQRHWDAMHRWIDYIHAANPDNLWTQRRNSDFGDWVAVGSETPKEVLATAFYAQSTRIVALTAALLGKKDDAERYATLDRDIRAAFAKAFVADDGRIKGDTQTCYALALELDLLPEPRRAAALDHLVADIAAKGQHLSTGFLGVNSLLPALTHGGRLDVAHRLAQNDTFPSWGYSIRNGATTIWERWDGYTTEKGFQDPGMNSFNHYAFGSIGEWMYDTIAGIALDPDQPGYKHVIVRPRCAGGLTHAEGTLESMYGTIATSWRRDSDRFFLDVTIPANTRATVFVPAASQAGVTEGDKPVEQVSEIRFQRMEGNAAVYSVASGSYRFASTLPHDGAGG